MKPESTTMLVNRLVSRTEDREKVFQAVAEKERFGYTFENANASLELLIARILNGKKLPFAVASYHVSIRGSMEDGARNGHVCEASIKVRVSGAEFFEVSDGNGPVCALDGAIRLALSKSRLPCLDSIKLVGYSVGLVAGTAVGTDAKTYVQITTSNGPVVWSTAGVSENVIEASLLALVDSLEYAFMVQTKK
ncbi:MAG: alpha-isopropylmalate synthase regulatory domain-containing protein [Patescibacteria group bacterium]